MRWLLGSGILFALASVLFVVPASAEGPALITVSAGHGLSLVDMAALVPLLTGTGLLAGGLWQRRQGLDAELSRRPWLARAGAGLAGLGLGLRDRAGWLDIRIGCSASCPGSDGRSVRGAMAEPARTRPPEGRQSLSRNGGYSSVTSANAYPNTRLSQRMTPWTKSNAPRG